MAAATLASCFLASWLFGSWPWSCPTLTLMQSRSYQVDGEAAEFNPRAVGTPGNAAVEQIVEMVDRPDVAVLATGRIAAHLLHTKRLESVEQAVVRWENLAEEAGEGRSAIEVFDWIVLDRYERFQQSSDKTDFIVETALQAGYGEQQSSDGLIVFRRPRG
jgi:hypothetical protein